MNEETLEYLKKLIEVTKENNKNNELNVGIEITVEMAENIVNIIEDLKSQVFEAEEYLNN